MHRLRMVVGPRSTSYMGACTVRKASEFCTSLAKFLFVGPFIKID